MKTMVNRVLQLILPLLFLRYFGVYLSLTEVSRRGAVTRWEMWGAAALYFLLILLFVYMLVQNGREKGERLFAALGLAEALVIYIVPNLQPYVFSINIRFLNDIMSNLIVFLYLYGAVVLLYAVQLIYLLKKRNP